MKVIMVYPLPSPVSPQKNCALSIIYPGRAAEDAGHEVEFWDARLDDEGTLWESVRHTDVIAISSLSGFQLGESIRIARECKKRHPEKPIVWGGVHVTFQPIQSLREPFVDFVILGEGEIRLPRILKAIETGKGFNDIDGIGYKRSSAGLQRSEFIVSDTPEEVKGVVTKTYHDPDGCYDGNIIIRRRGPTLDLATQYVSVISPKTERLFRAAAERNEVILQTARGCPWSPTSCVFCSVAGQYTQHNPETGRSSSIYRCIPYELWKNDLLAICHVQPFDFIELEDENSAHFLKDGRYAALLQKLGIKYHLHLRSDQLKAAKETTIARLAASGCVRVHIGAESGNEMTLAQMRKNEPVQDHYLAAEALAKHGIEGVYTWIIGNPDETTDAIMDTLRVSDEVKALHPPGKSRATIYVLMPLPGTIVFDQAKKAGWPLPEDMEGWTELSAAFNPKLPLWMNNLYFIAGFHHNRFHKTAQNFPGWWRIMILPFELVIEKRWQLGIRTKNPKWFSYFKFEYWCITQLLKWRSKKSAGQGTSQLPKLLERFLPGMAGH